MTRKPNWEKWSHIPQLDLWQAVALSLDVDPDSLSTNAREDHSYEPRAKDRHQILEANFNARQKNSRLEPVPINHKGSWQVGGNYQTQGVTIQGFAGWADETWRGENDIPAELRALASRGSSIAGAPMRDSDSPNWAVWAHVPDVTRLEAVALSLNKEPSTLTAAVCSSDEFVNRMFVLGRTNDLRPTAINMEDPKKSRVKLRDFAVFAVDLWRGDIPEGLAALAPGQPSRADLQALITELEQQNQLLRSQLGELSTSAANVTQSREDNIHRVIVAMAVKKYDWSPTAPRNKATGENAGSIAADVVATFGPEAGPTNDTIKTILENAAKSLEYPPKQKS